MRATITCYSCLFLLSTGMVAQAQEQLTNGDFETGALVGWQTFVLPATPIPPDLGGDAGNFFLSTPGANTPAVNGFDYPTAPNPTGGDFYAVSNSDYSGARALIQDFTINSNRPSYQLQFQLFVNDPFEAGPQVGPGLASDVLVDPSDPSQGFVDNQQVRVDLLRAGANPFSTDAADVVRSFALGLPYGAGPNPFVSYSFDVTADVVFGQSYRLRFADVSNLGPLNTGVDNVSLQAVVPESGPVALLFGLVTTGGCLIARRSNCPRFRK